MKKHILPIAIVAAALLVAGCLPEAYVWWSPDGRTAAVRTAAGLRLAGTNGQLSAVVLSGEIQSAAWLPDGSGLVVSRSFQLTNWADVEGMIPPDEATVAKRLAQAVPGLLKVALTASGGSSEDLAAKFLQPLGLAAAAWPNADTVPIWACALNRHREQITAVLAGFTNAAALETGLLSSATNGISVYEMTILSIHDGQPAGEPRALVRSLHPLLNPLPSPRQPLLAFQTTLEGCGALKVMTLDGKKSMVVAAGNASAAAWSPDGRTLFHVVTGKSDKMDTMLGEIRSSAVVDDHGELAKDPPRTETLTLAAFAGGPPPRLSVLPDGRILFASMPVTLPARIASLHPGALFFLLHPGKPDAAPVAVTIKEGSLPDDLSSFAASPDGRFVAVAEGNTDVVAVLELATGKVRIISPTHTDRKTRLIPAWRNAGELTFAALPHAAAARPELILWQAGMPARVLSKDWPDSVVKPWLEAPGTTTPSAK